MKRHGHLLLAAAGFVALRAAYLSVYGWASGWEHNGFPASDARGYDLVATNLLEGRGFAILKDGFVLQAYTALLYSVFLAIVYSLFGHSYHAVKIVQQGLDLGSALLVYGIASRLFNRRAGLAAALVFAAYPAYAAYSVALMTETFFLFLLTAALFALTRAADTPAPGIVLVAGLVTGLATLARPAGASIVPAALILLLFGRRCLRGNQVILFLVAFSVTLLPWLLRNYSATGGIYFAEVGPRQFWTGSNPQYDGATFSRDAGSQLLWRDPSATELERAQRMVREAIAFIAQEPERYLRFLARRSHALWLSVPHAPTPPSTSALALGLSKLFSFVEATALPLGVLGLVRAIAHWRITVLLGMTALTAVLFHLVFGALYRYRLPFDVIFVLYAGYFVALLTDVRHVEWQDFSILCRRDPCPARPAPAGPRSRARFTAFGGLLVGTLVSALGVKIAWFPEAAGSVCELSSEALRHARERLRALSLVDEDRTGPPRTYQQIRIERARHAGRVGGAEGALVIWGGRLRYAVRDAQGRVTQFDFFVNHGPDKLGDDIIAVTPTQPLTGLRDGQCVIVAGVVQERRVGADPYARPLIRPVSVQVGDER